MSPKAASSSKTVSVYQQQRVKEMNVTPQLSLGPQ